MAGAGRDAGTDTEGTDARTPHAVPTSSTASAAGTNGRQATMTLDHIKSDSNSIKYAALAGRETAGDSQAVQHPTGWNSLDGDSGYRAASKMWQHGALVTGPKASGNDRRDAGKQLEHLRRAAEQASDPDRLLPGEPADSEHADDAELWVEVYSELLDYKERLLAVTREKLAELHDERARREVVETDAVVIEGERTRFERRREFWRTRLGHGR